MILGHHQIKTRTRDDGGEERLLTILVWHYATPTRKQVEGFGRQICALFPLRALPDGEHTWATHGGHPYGLFASFPIIEPGPSPGDVVVQTLEAITAKTKERNAA